MKRPVARATGSAEFACGGNSKQAAKEQEAVRSRREEVRRYAVGERWVGGGGGAGGGGREEEDNEKGKVGMARMRMKVMMRRTSRGGGAGRCQEGR